MTKPGLAQNAITPDATLGAEASQIVPFAPLPTVELIQGGAVRGQNLFHSFEQFNVGEVSSAYFIIPSADIGNVFARITGGDPSQILGVLGTRQGDLSVSIADLFLMNPNGIIFGDNASLDVGGSFMATTANSIEFGEAGEFSAVNPEAPSSLLNIDPSAYILNQIYPSEIRSSSTFGLQVPEGESLELRGSNIAIDGGGTGSSLFAPNGQIVIEALENLEVFNQARIDVGGGGSITVRANGFSLSENSLLASGIGQTSIDAQRGTILVKVEDKILMSSSFIGSFIDPQNPSFSDGADIEILTGSIFISNGSQIISSSFGTGDAGNIAISARGVVRLDGITQDNGSSSGIFSTAQSGSIGNGGDIVIEADSLEVFDGAQITAATLGLGDAGNVTLAIADTAYFGGVNPITGFGSGVSSSVEPSGEGQGGDVELLATNLVVTNGAQITASTLGLGNAGSVILLALETASFSGLNSGVFSSVGIGGVGQGGNVELLATNLEVTSGAQITASTLGLGNAGNVILLALETASFSELNSGVFSSVGIGGEGNGGDLRVEAGNLNIMGGATLSAENRGIGEAGNIFLVIDDRLTGNDATITTSSFAGLGTQKNLVVGRVEITAQSIGLFGDSDIITFNLSEQGASGDIVINSNLLVASDDSDFLVFASSRNGGEIIFGGLFLPESPIVQDSSLISFEDFLALDGNGRVDIALPGALPRDPDLSGIGYSPAYELLLTNNLLLGSCIARTAEGQGTFVATGSGGIPTRPGDGVISSYPTGNVQSLPNPEPQAVWQPGDPIVEPTDVFSLPDGRLVLSRACDDN